MEILCKELASDKTSERGDIWNYLENRVDLLCVHYGIHFCIWVWSNEFNGWCLLDMAVKTLYKRVQHILSRISASSFEVATTQLISK